jgi:hypothetical protein
VEKEEDCDEEWRRLKEDEEEKKRMIYKGMKGLEEKMSKNEKNMGEKMIM